MNNSLIIVGAGGHGRVVASTAQLACRWDKIAFVDDLYPELQKMLHWPVIGSVTDLGKLVGEWNELVVAIGNNARRLEVLEISKVLGFKITTVIHPSAQIADDVGIGAGVVVFANAVINVGTSLEDGCIVNIGATIDHDNYLGRGVHISPGVHLAGSVKIGNRSWIGIGASVIQGCVIGCDVIVGAGAAVVKNISDGVTAVGVPAKELKK